MLQAGERLLWSGPAAPAAPVRFITATNRELGELVEHRDFHRELFWRLNVFALEVPPLRRRGDDIPMLARYFLRRTNPRRAFTSAALKMLSTYAFPGNLLELESLVARVAIAPLAAIGHNLIDVPDIRQQLVFAAGPGELQPSGWKSSREQARREMILRTIAAAGGNRVEAARRLGITTRALQYHITKAGLSRRRTIQNKADRHSPVPTPPPVTLLQD
jgi:transcriptional regulator with GAF, ATPase, and Fis domain